MDPIPTPEPNQTNLGKHCRNLIERTCNPVRPGFCKIVGRCVAAGTVNPLNPCTECQPDLSPTAWSVDDSNDCSDGLFCNGSETCQAGVCTRGPKPCSNRSTLTSEPCDEDHDRCAINESTSGCNCGSQAAGPVPLAWFVLGLLLVMRTLRSATRRAGRS